MHGEMSFCVLSDLIDLTERGRVDSFVTPPTIQFRLKRPVLRPKLLAHEMVDCDYELE